MNQYSVERYKGNKYGIYALRSECFILLGRKKDLIKKCEELNALNRKVNEK